MRLQWVMKSETWWQIGVGAFLFVGMLWKFPDLYVELKAWQTSIAALLGFGGLIWAVKLSAKKQRDRDDLIRDQEIQAIARGLRSEISNITLFLKATIDAIEIHTTESGVSKDSLVPAEIFEELYAPPTPQLYERCLEKIGFLPDKTSKKVMAYYEHLATAKNSVATMVRAHPSDMNLAHAQQIADIYKNLSPHAQGTIASLDKFLEKNSGDAA